MDSSTLSQSRTINRNGARNEESEEQDKGCSKKTYRDFSRIDHQAMNDSSYWMNQEIVPKEPPFPVKLHAMLSNPSFQDIIFWLPHGRSWRILKQRAFEEKVIPQYFSHGRYTSFARQVNGWGFRRVTSGTDLNSYYHELFLRGMPHLCNKMRRLTAKDIRNRKKTEDVPAPNFYELTRRHPLPGGSDESNDHFEHREAREVPQIASSSAHVSGCECRDSEDREEAETREEATASDTPAEPRPGLLLREFDFAGLSRSSQTAAPHGVTPDRVMGSLGNLVGNIRSSTDPLSYQTSPILQLSGFTGKSNANFTPEGSGGRDGVHQQQIRPPSNSSNLSEVLQNLLGQNQTETAARTASSLLIEMINKNAAAAAASQSAGRTGLQDIKENSQPFANQSLFGQQQEAQDQTATNNRSEMQAVANLFNRVKSLNNIFPTDLQAQLFLHQNALQMTTVPPPEQTQQPAIDMNRLRHLLAASQQQRPVSSNTFNVQGFPSHH